MSDTEPDDAARNLLFGLLAFQNNFINRRALLAAFDTWTSDKSRSLGRILTDQGDLSIEMLAMLEGLVQAHLSQHDNDPEKSLAALTPIGSLLKDLESLADAAMQATLSHVSTDRDAEDDPFAARGSSSSRVRFKIIRPLNKGGMGVVSVALDTELDRSIALKEIRETAADDRAYRARFLAEAEITGKLEHPGIIPIYGLGTCDDGRPFYAMRLIRGDKTGSLMDAIKTFHRSPDPDPSARVVAFRSLLGRFLDVCNALSYAHSKGVLHRDLKPDNILLGPYGETLVVDWGLAKATGRSDTATSPDADQILLNLSGSELNATIGGRGFGTPGYAPPEQMTGDLANIGPRSDVYGLGAVLYCLMTGQAPFSRRGIDLGQLVKKIETGDFPPPRQIRTDLEKPLEAICLKALSTKPADRYPSVKDLATDIERHLADEPVTAFREPWSVRARRWTKKHRTGVTAAASSLLVGSVGLVAVAVVLAEKNIALDRQRQRAEERETQAIEAVKRFGEVVRDTPELKNNPALEGLRKSLLKEPLAFFRDLRDSLQAEADTRPEALERLAGASFNLGHLTLEIGDQQDALSAFREGLPIYQKLVEANPAVTAFQSALATTQQNIGLVLSNTGKTAEALEAYESALALQRQLAEANPDVTEFYIDITAIYDSIGDVLRATGKTAEALTAYESTLDLRRKLAEANPAVTSFQSGLAASHFSIGNLLRATGKTAEALEAYWAAQATWRKLAEANPAVTSFQSDLATTDNHIGNLLRVTGKTAEALASYGSALATWRKLAEANPAVTSFQSGLAATHYSIGNLLRATGKPAEALASYGSALDLRRKLAEANPAVTEFQNDLAASHNSIGLVLSNTGKTAEALASYGSALALQRKLAEANPDVTEFQSDLAGSHNNIGNLLSETGEPAEALASYGSALSLRRKLAEANPDVTEFQNDLAASHNSIGVLLRATGKPAEALASYGSALDLRRKLAEGNPADIAFQSGLADSHHSIGNLLSATGKPAEALVSYGSALDLRRKLAEANPDVTEFQSVLAGIHNNMGLALTASGKPAEALEAYGSALSLQRKLVLEHPASPDFASDLGGTLNNMAMINLDANHFGEARDQLLEAVEWQRKALRSHPAHPKYRQFLANHLTNLIGATRGLGDSAGVAEAERELEKLRD